VQAADATDNNNYLREPPATMEKNNTYVVQKYIKHPALIDGHKFDFRIYVLVTSVVDPLTIFLYDDGLVRLASEKYNLNLFSKAGGNS
jgi:tubulin polyglutamylase TTLL6/13